MKSAVDAWVEEPLLRFVRDARVRLALVLEASGRVLAQHGFTRSVDVMSACALAAAIQASSAELGRQLDGAPFGSLHHDGADRQLFLGAVPTPGGLHLLLAVFDDATSIGLVRLYFSELRGRLAAAAPAKVDTAGLAPALDEHFERDLDHNLARLFGRL